MYKCTSMYVYHGTRVLLRVPVHVVRRPFIHLFANFYVLLSLKPFSVCKIISTVTMGAKAELQVDTFSTNTGHMFQGRI